MVEVSVIIPVLNGAWCIGQQLAALARQTTSRSFEVVVCDNGSVDSTTQVCQMWVGRVPGLRIVDASDRRSASHARNVGIGAALGQVLLFCDADDMVSDDWVEVMASYVRPGAMVNGWGDYTLLNSPDSYQGAGLTDGLIMRCGFKPGIESGNLGVSARDARAVGGFDESYPYAEDIDFGWRAQVAGVELSSVPALVHYRVRAGAKDVFRQHRRWSIYSIMLRRRWVDQIPPSYSLRYSVIEFVRQSVLFPARWATTRGHGRRELLRQYGTAVGELEGLLRFKVLGSPPGPDLATF
ncbi:glycosyltransferase family 2 protein [Propionibacteriaceae bacterium Y1923]|uniref:glycosyltransferase family 2 protein n=1 Tax=Aestuariimicrobium sp. Y1814 TaxID=3418742 RepID=UPI003C2991E8